ncbi:MAG: outer membrane beta-barrel protein [Bacteroidia bacterium]
MRLGILLVVGALWAQENLIGISGGLTIPAYRSPDPIERAIVQLGYSVGASAQKSLSSRTRLRIDLLYTQRKAGYMDIESYKADTTVGPGITDTYTVYITNSGDLILKHVELPIMVSFDFLSRETFKSYLTCGLQLCYRVKSAVIGDVQVALEGLDVLPLFGFPSNARVIVAQEKADPHTLTFYQTDVGFVVGGGSLQKMGPLWMDFQIRYYHGLRQIVKQPADSRLYNGGFSLLWGFYF